MPVRKSPEVDGCIDRAGPFARPILKHAGSGLWCGKELPGPHGVFADVGSTQRGGLRLGSLDDLPPDEVLLDVIRASRLDQALEWVAEGKPRTWKYRPREG